MADDKSLRGSPDNKRLNRGEDYEVRYAKEKARKAAAKKAAPSKRVAAKSPAANGNEPAPQIASSPPLDSTTMLNEYIVSSSRVSEIATSASSPAEIVTADELQQFGASAGTRDALKGMIPQFMAEVFQVFFR